MRVAVMVLSLALTAGVISCRHANTDSASSTETPSTVESAQPEVAAAAPVLPASGPLHSDPAPAPQVATAVPAGQAGIDFDTDVKPILEARCQPCHFPGGVMYERRPFDRPETITALGTKLFTRLKDPDEQQVIREFLAQQPGGAP